MPRPYSGDEVARQAEGARQNSARVSKWWKSVPGTPGCTYDAGTFSTATATCSFVNYGDAAEATVLLPPCMTEAHSPGHNPTVTSQCYSVMLLELRACNFTDKGSSQDQH